MGNYYNLVMQTLIDVLPVTAMHLGITTICIICQSMDCYIAATITCLMSFAMYTMYIKDEGIICAQCDFCGSITVLEYSMCLCVQCMCYRA